MSSQTTATGGSATSQANDASNRAWSGSATKSRLVRFTMFAVPLIAGYVAGLTFAIIVPRPSAIVLIVAWWIGALLVSAFTIRAARPLIQGLAPLAFLYQCTLVFPDEAPNRYKMALRQRSARELARKVENGEPLGDTPEEAAENVLSLLAALNDHDRLTRGHSERVRAYTDLIAENMGLPEDERQKLHWAALLHDVGKMGVDPAILNKQGRPTDEEWQSLRKHPQQSAALLRPLRPWLGSWLDAATQHHERWDGGGYPRGLAGEQISLSGRIVAVADAFDVMTSARSYKKAWSFDDARQELARCAGTQFDPTVVRAFLTVSTGRLQRVAGPLVWLANVPRLAEAVSVATTAGSSAAAATSGAVAAATLIVAPMIAVTYDGPIAAGAVESVSVSSQIAPDDLTAPTTTVVTVDNNDSATNAEPDTGSADAEVYFALPVLNGDTVRTTTSVEVAASSTTTAPIAIAPATTGLQPARTTTTSRPTTTSVTTTTTTTTTPSTTTTAPSTTVAPTTTTTAAPTTTTTTTTLVYPDAQMVQLTAAQLAQGINDNTLISTTSAWFAPLSPVTLGSNLTVTAAFPDLVTTEANRYEVTLSSGQTVCGVALHANRGSAGRFMATITTDRNVLGFVMNDVDWERAELPITGVTGVFGSMSDLDSITVEVSGGESTITLLIDLPAVPGGFDNDSVIIVTDCASAS